jgi:magnesium transporter
MLYRHELGGDLIWYEVERPNAADIRQISTAIKTHPLILEEISGVSDRNKVERFGDHLYLVYHVPLYNPLDRASRKAEIDFLVSKNVLVTVTYESVEPIKLAAKKNSKAGKIRSIPELLYEILREANDFSLRELRHIEVKANRIGSHLFRKQDEKLLEEVSYVKRDLLNFSVIAAPQRTTLESLLKEGPELLGGEWRVYFTDLLGDFMKVHFLLENLRATVESYGETISQIFNFRATQVMRRVSVLGFLTFPLVLYSTIALEPNVAKTFIHGPSDFWIVFGSLAIFIILLAYLMRHKNLL